MMSQWYTEKIAQIARDYQDVLTEVAGVGFHFLHHDPVREICVETILGGFSAAAARDWAETVIERDNKLIWEKL